MFAIPQAVYPVSIFHFMTIFANKAQSVSAWAAVVHAGQPEPMPAEPTGSLAPVLLQGAAEQRAQNINGWFDVELVNFSADTWQFINITEGDIRTGLRHQTHEVGKLLHTFGATKEEFIFADPQNDVKAVKLGITRSLRPVMEQEVLWLLSEAGVFDARNKAPAAIDKGRYNYAKEEGKSYHKLDFSTTQLVKIVNANLYAKYENKVVPFLFYLDGVAYNYYNFGNFLFGAAGAALGLMLGELLAGAHYNSLTAGKDTNGYEAQLDSSDDQFCIKKGFEHASRRNYTQCVKRWARPQSAILLQNKKH